MLRPALIALLFAAVACGDNGLAPPDAPPDAAPPTAPRLPTAVSGGGPVLAAPEIVPIFFAGDASVQVQLEDFLTHLVPSSYWTATVSEYGVGAPTLRPSIISTETPPTTDAELQRFIESHLYPVPGSKTGRSGWPPPNANTIYVVFLPAGVTLTFGADTSCVTFGGYHDETDEHHVVYALLPRCASMIHSPIDEVTPALSHELIEAATDPHPNTASAYNQTDDNDLIWEFTPGGELGDMCEYVAAAIQPLVGAYRVQRTWSNASAAAGHDPCVPVLPAPYVVAAPVLGDVNFNYGQGQATTLGIEVPLGTPVTIPLALSSDDPTAAAWTINADDVASVLQSMPAELAFSFDRTTGSNGDTVMMTITRQKTGANGGSEFVVTSKVNGTVVSLWWGLATD